MQCCFRPPARASTCSVTTGIGEKCFAWRWKESSMLRSISPGRAPLAEYDSGVLWAALLLLTLGMVMVYSSSIAMAEASKFTGGKSAYFLEHPRERARFSGACAPVAAGGAVAFRARRRAAR